MAYKFCLSTEDCRLYETSLKNKLLDEKEEQAQCWKAHWILTLS